MKEKDIPVYEIEKTEPLETKKKGEIKSVTVAEVLRMTYEERLANYEREKMLIPRMLRDSRTVEQALRALARKWRV